MLYFESLGRSEICPTISAYRTYRVINQKPAYVLVYDYYDQSRRARSFYQVDPGSQCDIADDGYVEDCGDRPTFLNFESFQFGTNVDLHNIAQPGLKSSYKEVICMMLISFHFILLH